MNTILHKTSDITVDLLSDPNLMVVKYKFNHRNNHGDESKLKSCTPGMYYLVLKDTTQDKYKLITRNEYNKEQDSYTYINADDRFKEFKISFYRFNTKDLIVPIIYVDANYKQLDIFAGTFNGLKGSNTISNKIYSKTWLKSHFKNTILPKINDLSISNILSKDPSFKSMTLLTHTSLKTIFTNTLIKNNIEKLQASGRSLKDLPETKKYYFDLETTIQQEVSYTGKIIDYNIERDQYDWKFISDRSNLCGEIQQLDTLTLAKSMCNMKINSIVENMKLDDEIFEEVLNYKPNIKTHKILPWINKTDKEILLSLINK